jgi:hypothetical protein
MLLLGDVSSWPCVIYTIHFTSCAQTAKNATLPVDFWDREMTSYFGAVERAHNATGGTAAHLFLSVPSRNSNVKIRADEFNAALVTYVRDFAKKHPTTPVVLFDDASWFSYTLTNFAKYGFKDNSSYCTCDDNSYFWYSECKDAYERSAD